MKSALSDQPKEKSAFDFYHGYLAVIYGLVATKGLENLIAFPSDRWSPFVVFLFLGSFLTSLHFWFVCATVDDLSHNFYWVLAGRKESWFDLLLLFDALVATGFAGLVLAMFQSISPKPERFFLWFLVAAGLSFLYDFYSRFLVFHGRRVCKETQEQNILQGYRGKVNNWIREDFIFALGAVGIYYFGVRSSVGFGVAFATFTSFLLLMDVDLVPI